jgi:hypothetical protein
LRLQPPVERPPQALFDTLERPIEEA